MKKKHIWFILVTFIMAALVVPAHAAAEDGGKVNINTAGVDQLTTLKGIGAKLAQKIIDYRTQTGPFKKAEDIKKVPGIGEKVWEANKDKIVVK